MVSWGNGGAALKDTSNEGVVNKRAEMRLDTRAAVFVELPVESEPLAAGEPFSEQQDRRRLMLCRLLDFSANGVRIRIDRPLPEGGILRLCAQIPGGEAPLNLVGEVRWVREDGEHYQVGFSLFEADQTDILAWKKLLLEQL